MKYCLLLMAAILAFTSCEKLEVPESREDMLRQGKWRLTAASVRYKDPITGGDSTQNGLPLEGCDVDNFIVFRENFLGAVNYGANKCAQQAADEVPFNWQLTDNGNKINIYNAEAAFGTSDVNGTFNSFSSSTFTMQYMLFVQVNVQKRDTFTYTTTFTKF